MKNSLGKSCVEAQLPDGIAFSLDIISPHIPASLPSARQISAFINKLLSTKVSLNNMPWYFFFSLSP